MNLGRFLKINMQGWVVHLMVLMYRVWVTSMTCKIHYFGIPCAQLLKQTWRSNCRFCLAAFGVRGKLYDLFSTPYHPFNRWYSTIVTV